MLLLWIIFFSGYAVGPHRGNSFFHLAVLRAKTSMLEATGTCFFSMRDHPCPATVGAADGIGGFRTCPSPSLILRQGHLLKEIALLVSLMHDEPESALINGIFAEYHTRRHSQHVMEKPLPRSSRHMFPSSFLSEVSK